MSNKNRNRKTGGSLSQFGLFEIPTDFNIGEDNSSDIDENDSDIEAELAALTKPGSALPTRPARKPKQPQLNVNLDSMISESMRDIASDEELSGDDDDPELLSELQELTAEEVTVETQPAKPQESPSDMTKLLEDRLKMYQLAESNAKAAGEGSRARRFGRGIKTLTDLLKQAQKGKIIKDEDIPPEVAVNIKKPPQPSEPTQPSTDSSNIPVESPVIPEQIPEQPPPAAEPATPINTELLNLLNSRKNQYKAAALNAKKAGDKETAMTYLKIFKQFEGVIKVAESGQPVDLTNMPGPPAPLEAPKEESETQNASPTTETTEEPPEKQLITASSVAEALQQHMEVYKKQEETAKEQGNSSKARRMGRIVKQFEQAIKLNNAGKLFPTDELPVPPGYAPIAAASAETAEPETPKPSPVPKRPPSEPASPQTPSPTKSSRKSGNHTPNSRSEKQLALLIARQKEFKLAALAAKRNGEIEQAKEYLKNVKRLDPLIEAATGGLPVDLSSLPLSPTAKIQLDSNCDTILADERAVEDSGDLDIISRLEAQLTKQLKMCLSTRDHHKALGDVAGTNRFERLALSVTKDLDFVRLARRTGGTVPKFHYEIKDFSIVKSFTELADNDMELTILRGIQYTCSNPKEIDTYVKFEFPYPQDEMYRDKTATIKDTNNPEYNASFVIPIQRTARNCLRVFKRHGIKFEIYSRGGFFRSDTLLGTVNVKLQPLETQCELHDSFDLMEGRKKVGGKLEVRVRVRHPMLTQQVEKIEEKWLVIEHTID